jgi:hypothetical protein
MALKIITINNDSKSAVTRANRHFPAGSRVKIIYDVDTRKFKEISACANLKIIDMVDLPPAEGAVGMVVKVTEESAVVDPEVAIKDDITAEEASEAGAILAHHKVEEREASEAAATLAKYEKEEAARFAVLEAVALEKFEPVVEPPDAAELEVLEDTTKMIPKNKQIKNCPYCDFTGVQAGLYLHVRKRHPDDYEEYKVRVKNS